VRAIVAGGALLAGVGATAAAASVSVSSPVWAQFQQDPTHAAASTSAIRPPLEQAWRVPYGSSSGQGVSGAIVANSLVIAVGVEHVYAVDASTGALAWQVRRNGGPIAMPAVGVAGHRELLAFTEGRTSSDARLRVIDLVTRRDLPWSPVRLKDVSMSGVTVGHGQVIVGDRSGNLYAFDLATGSSASWSPAELATGAIEAPPAAAPSEIVAVTRNRSTGDVRVVGVDRTSGRPVWSYTTRVAAGTGSAVSLDGDRAVFGIGNEQYVRAVSLSSRGAARTVWSARTRSTFSPLSAPAVAGGTVFVISTSTSDGAVYALNASDGAKRWDFQFQTAAIQTSPVVAGDTVYVGTEDGLVAGIDVATGVEVWQADTGAGAIGPLAVAGDQLIASKRGRHGGLIAYRPNPGGTLLHVESPTKLNLGTDLVRFAIAFAIVAGLLLLAALALRRAAPRAGVDHPTPRQAGPDLEPGIDPEGS
jgi:outer membrane protein assembly factor BamB